MHITALAFSGWFGKVMVYKGATWSELLGYSSKFWPLQTLSLAHYDITEFLIYYAFLPYIVYKIISSTNILEKKNLKHLS